MSTLTWKRPEMSQQELRSNDSPNGEAAASISVEFVLLFTFTTRGDSFDLGPRLPSSILSLTLM